ncbi:MAG: hypothetical protein R6X32_05915 [Chloroflexota bacterium]
MIQKQQSLIQFAELDDMLKELNPGDVVRVQSICITEAEGYNGLVSVRCWGVAVRHITKKGLILSCWLPAYRTQIMGQSEKGKEKKGWELTYDMEQQIKPHLKAFDLDIRPGIVFLDLGASLLVKANWANRPQKTEQVDDGNSN